MGSAAAAAAAATTAMYEKVQTASILQTRFKARVSSISFQIQVRTVSLPESVSAQAKNLQVIIVIVAMVIIVSFDDIS